MRLKSLLLFLPALLAAEELNLPKDFKADPKRPDIPLSFSASRKYLEDKLAIQEKYRFRLAAALEQADAVEVMLLDPTTVETILEGKEADFFPVLPYRSYAKIIQRKQLGEAAAVKCRRATVELLQEKNQEGAFCHFPVHAIRLFREKQVIFQTSICWECANYYLEYPDDFETASWVGLSGKGLKDLLMSEVPVPAADAKGAKAATEEKHK